MAKKKRPGFGTKLLLFLLQLVLAVVVLFFVARALPGDLSFRSLRSGLSNSLLITTPEPENTVEEPTLAPTFLPDPTNAVVVLEPTVPAFSDDDFAPDETDEGDAFAADEPGDGFDDDLPEEQGNALTGLSDPVGDEPAVPDITFAPVVTPAPIAASEPVEITISAAGDCTLGGDETNGGFARFKKYYDSQGEEYFLANVREIFEADDLTIVNLEGALTKATTRKDKTFAFRGNPAYVRILTSGSVELVSLDNNHSQDYYSQGTADTKKTLNYVGIGYAGLGEKHIAEVKGLKVGFLSYRVWDMSVDGMTADVKEMREECDLVVVSMHWGEEKQGKANATQIKLGHAAVDAGADLVLGTHPHVVGSIEIYNGKYIVYSLGNFCFGGNSNPADKDTFIFQQTFTLTDGEITGTDVSIIPCRVSSSTTTNDYQPTPVPYDEGGKAILKKIVDCSKQFDSVPDWEAIVAKLTEAN